MGCRLTSFLQNSLKSSCNWKWQKLLQSWINICMIWDVFLVSLKSTIDFVVVVVVAAAASAAAVATVVVSLP